MGRYLSPFSVEDEARLIEGMSQTALAKLLNVTPFALWKVRDEIPRNADDSYDATAVVAWWIERRAKRRAIELLRELARRIEVESMETKRETPINEPERKD